MSNSENSNRDAENTPIFPYDYGPNSFIIDLNKAAQQNDNFRATLWTGTFLQVTLMSIPVHGSIGMEVHTDHDQILRIEDGLGLVQLGESQLTMYGQYLAFTNYVIAVPAGIWHNIINIGNVPLKISSYYAPPNYAWNTVQRTRTPAASSQNIS
ncbi:cupin domain-containing protein [Lacrimispora celerecrescens]|uniref:Mannose-6-phosphate isomerase-like protein (Cupin superfamily) n=1 Tax=[Clostridium] celerecrescens 18A TaxID=1286362 RepID=A0A2M8ZBP0_9FIRM|nr:cupin domain-containing protein [Lacrimispora celerecrescens]PJJ30872.1 mannose-6-phosphate isomerase-like protein (cupin superfamily) [[Clostridium] celerecrescens 18A]